MTGIYTITVQELSKELRLPSEQVLIGSAETGEEAKNRVLRKIIENTSKDEVVQLDFSGIMAANSAFLCPLLFGLQLDLYKLTKNILIIMNTNETLDYDILGSVLVGQYVAKEIDEKYSGYSRRKLNQTAFAILIKKNTLYTKFDILGQVEPAVKDAFEFLQRRVKLTPTELASATGIPLNNACNRLRKLYELRLVNRYEIATAPGKPLVYFMPQVERNQLFNEVEIEEFKI